MFARIGDILVRAGIVKPEEIEEALEISADLGVSIGKTLVMSGYITEPILQAAVQLQSLIKDGLVLPDMGLNAIRLSHERSFALGDALRECGWQPRSDVGGNKLGDFLVEAELLTQDSLAEALQTARETNLPLGRILVLNGHIHQALLWSVLNAQVLVRDGRISKEQSIAAIKETAKRQANIDQVLNEQGIDTRHAKRSLRLGEILVMSGLLKEEYLLNAVEVGLMSNKPLGEVLIERGIVGSMIIERSLQIQKFVDEQALQAVHAPEVLRFVIQHKCTVSKAILELGLANPVPANRLRLGDLLKLAGLVTQEELDEVVRLSLKNSALLGKMLVIAGLMEDELVQAALDCQNMIRDGKIKEEQAIIGLNYCVRMRCNFAQAVQDLGWAESVETLGKTALTKIALLKKSVT